MLKELRLDKGWSQQQLAQFSGLSSRTIQRVERGQSIGLESLKCLAATLSLSLAELQTKLNQSCEQFLGATPILPVSSVRETAQFYQQQLGFEIETL